METDENEEKLLRSVALQNANTILLARQQAEAELRALKDRLAADLQAMTHLHHVGSYCVQPGQDFDECLGEIVEAAIAVTGANKGKMQLLDASSGALKLVAHRGFDEPFLNFFAMVRDEAAACGPTQRSERVVVEDITQSRTFAGTPALDVLLDAGVRAVQSTPLLSSTGHLLGMISTYFSEPRHISERELRLMDLLARQAADFVERKGAEEALRQSEEQFRSVFNQTTGGIAQTDLTGRFVLVNDRYCQIVGRSREELLKLRMHDITHPEDLPSSAEQFRALTEGGPNFVIEKRYLRPDGSAVWVHNDVAAIRDAEGNVRYIAAAVADITERKQAAEARARLAAIVESSDDAIISKDLNGVITSWNEGAEQLFGYTAQEAIGKPVALLIPPDRLHEGPAILERLKRGERVEHFETIRLRKDGTALDISLTISPVRDATGRIVGASKVARDITERKRAEEALRQSEQRFARFMEHLPGLAWTKDLKGRYTYANELAKKVFRKTDEQLYGKTDDEIFPPESAAQFKANDQRALTNGAGVQVVETLQDEDGTLHHSLVSKFPIRGEDGAPLAIGGMAIDITERKMAEEALREQQERWKLAAQVGRFGQWQLDLATSALRASDLCKANFGLQPEDELSYQRLFELIHPEDRDRVRAHETETTTGHRAYEAEYRVIWPDGSTHWINARGSAFYSDDGTPLRMIGVTLDITERKQAEEALKQADRRKDEFLATLAHELRNPLAPIRNSLHILRMTGGNAPAAERVHEMMERQVNHMVRLVDDLMEISRITRGQVELRKERIEFASVIRSAVETAKPAIESAGHQLHITVPPEPVLLEGDPVRLAQVFGNLLNNAAKYTEKSGKIWIDAKLAGEDLTVSVRDTGVGVAAEMLPRVFDLFMQANQNRAQGGLGIGLSLVRSLVKLHGGSVEAKSEGEGKGSEFIVRLPVAAARLHEFAHTAEYAAKPISPRRILVVDDNRDAADSLGMLLRFTGADAHVVYDGRAALEALDIYQPGIVLLDIGMPGMDGIEVARRIRCHPEFKNVTIIALTGWGQEQDRRLTRAAGFDHHLIKPADINALEALLASLEKRSA
ncbi:MAG: PAS domain S-box protein [Burkholderiales bacterium]